MASNLRSLSGMSEPLVRKETSGVGNGVSSTAGPMVRIRFPPAGSPMRTFGRVTVTAAFVRAGPGSSIQSQLRPSRGLLSASFPSYQEAISLSIAENGHILIAHPPLQAVRIRRGRILGIRCHSLEFGEDRHFIKVLGGVDHQDSGSMQPRGLRWCGKTGRELESHRASGQHLMPRLGRQRLERRRTRSRHNSQLP